MVAIKALSLLAVAGSVIAAPAANAGNALEARGYRQWADNSNDVPSQTQGGRKPNVVVENKNVVVTEYVTIPYGGQRPQRPRPTQAPAAPAAPAPEKPAPQQPASPAQPAQPQEPESKPWLDAPAPSEPASPPSGGSDTGYMAIVNEYRAKMGLPALEHSAKLESNALDAAASARGSLTHKLNEGSMGQVMAPGDSKTNFEHIFVGGWLCEIPSLLSEEICAEQSKGWNYQGQTGHAEILTDPKYTQIGCASADGGSGKDICSCDVA